VNREHLQRLAEERLADAKVLLSIGRWSASYYLSGYAVECGLKACILAHVERTGAIFLDRKFSEKCFSHRFEELLKAARLNEELNQAISLDPTLGDYWKLASLWTSESRYDFWTETEARDLVQVISDPQSGVLPWIRRHW
jgi:HEPN domain-containing protein